MRESSPRGPIALAVVLGAVAFWGMSARPVVGGPDEQGRAVPGQTQITLFADLDTYVGNGVNGSQGAASELRTGWRRRAENRTYIHFPLDPALHPRDGLDRAQLWLYPEQLPGTGPFQAEFRVQTLLAPFTADVRYPPFLPGGEPSTAALLNTEQLAWKQFTVTALVRTALRDIAEYHGFEVLSVLPDDDVRFDFVSTEGAPSREGNAPRLVMDFARNAFPSATPTVTPTPTVTLTPEASLTPAVSPTPTPVRRYIPLALRAGFS